MGTKWTPERRRRASRKARAALHEAAIQDEFEQAQVALAQAHNPFRDLHGVLDAYFHKLTLEHKMDAIRFVVINSRGDK